MSKYSSIETDALDRRAAEFGRLLEAIFERLHTPDFDLRPIGELAGELTAQEFRALEFLHAGSPRMMRQIAQHMRLAVNSATAMVDKMERRGLVQRARAADDRRVVHVVLTKRGRAAARTIVDAKLAINRSFLGALSEREQATLIRLYRKIAQARPAAEATTPVMNGKA